MTAVGWVYIATGAPGGLEVGFIVFLVLPFFLPRRSPLPVAAPPARPSFLPHERAGKQLGGLIRGARGGVPVRVKPFDARSTAPPLRKAKTSGVELKLFFPRHNLQHLPSLVHVFQKE